jgi:iron complex transport system substrate-binding protein
MKIIGVAAAAAVLCACGSSSVARNAPAAQRIVSLVPSLTEDLCAIGAGSRLVAVSQFTSDIPCAKALPEVSNYASVNAEAVLSLHADTVVAIPAQRAMTAALRRAGVTAVYLPDDSYADLFTDIARLGKLTGRSKPAQTLIASLQRRTKELQTREHFRRRPSVFIVVQAQPIWTVGPQSYISTLIGMAGGRNAVSSLPQAYAQYSAEALVRLQPDVIISTSDAHVQSVLDREPWRSLRAVREHRVYILSDDSIVVRPGPRYNQGLQWIIDRLRPIGS